MADALAVRLPGVRISLSSVIAPKYREYERSSTTVANAYVAPLVESYVSALSSSLADLGVAAEMSIMQSNGGVASAELACAYPIRIVESGPAAGVLMCAHVGREEGCNHVMTFDMGGTTAKLGAIDNGTPAVTSSFEVDAVHSRKGSGLPLSIMAIDLLEIGAGGGSIARTADGPDPRGTRQRGRRTRPDLLRPRRHAAHDHRCEPDPWLPQPGLLQRRSHATPTRSRRPLARTRDRPATRPLAGGGRLGRALDRECEHGTRHAHRLDRARPRPSAICARRVRWRGPATRLPARADAGDPPRDRAPRRGCGFGTRPARGRQEGRYRCDPGAAIGRGNASHAGRDLRGPGGARHRRSAPGTGTAAEPCS